MNMRKALALIGPMLSIVQAGGSERSRIYHGTSSLGHYKILAVLITKSKHGNL
jgi:hypothetical protein